MDSYAPTPEALVRPWRTRTIVAGSVAVVELLALLGLGIAYFGRHWFSGTRAAAPRQPVTMPHRASAAGPSHPTRAAAPAPRASAPMLPRRRTGVLVLNGNGFAGAAGSMARTLKERRYPVAAVGNAKRSDYARSMVMYVPGYGREAQRLARDVRIPIVTVLDGIEPRELDGAKLAVILGRD